MTFASRRFVVLLLMLVGSFVLLYRDVIAKLVHDWSIDENYSHGFLVVPTALYFVWERRRKLLATALKPNLLGLVITLGSIALLLAGILGAEIFTTEVSLVGAIAGSILFLLGWAHFRILLFPLVFLMLMVPLPAIVFNEITFPLQLLASRVGEGVLTLVQIPVLREGNVIHLANTSLEVAEACSGIRTLISLLMLGTVYGYVVDGRTAIRLVLAAATVPIAVITNGLRVSGTGIAAHFLGAAAAEGFLHTFSGWLVFVSAFVILLLLSRLIHWIFPKVSAPGVVLEQTRAPQLT